MTAIEWLIEKWHSGELNRLSRHREKIFEQAKEMEKQQIIDCLNEFSDETLSDEFCDKYIAKTYGSKGNDNLPKVQNKDSFGEISDEEIEMFADKELGTIRTDFDFGVIQGMKWYREQLSKLSASQEK